MSFDPNGRTQRFKRHLQTEDGMKTRGCMVIGRDQPTKAQLVMAKHAQASMPSPHRFHGTFEDAWANRLGFREWRVPRHPQTDSISAPPRTL